MSGTLKVGGKTLATHDTNTNVSTLTADEANVGSNALVVDSSGNVGIGTSNPAFDYGSGLEINRAAYASLKLKNTAASDAAYLMQDGGENTYLWNVGASPVVFGTSNTERMRIDSSGKVLVGYNLSNGSYKLQVNSQIYATSSTIATSDFNYKENITPLYGALLLVSQLNPVQFDWKEHPVHEFDRNQPTVGFIAQEVQQVLGGQPYLNSIVKSNECIIEPEETDEEGNVIKEAVTEEFLGIAEGNLVALLTKAIQEQQTLIESQQSQIDALTARIEALEATP